MSQAIILSIRELTNVVSGKFTSSFVVVDQASGELVGKKAHKTEAEAQTELGSLKYFAEGLAFARATAPEGASDKGLIGKANIIAAYLMFKETGVAEADAPEAEQEAPAAEDESFEG